MLVLISEVTKPYNRRTVGGTLVLKLLVAVFSSVAAMRAATVFVVVPNAQTGAVGNDTDSNNGTGGFHGQEVFGSGQFSSLPAEVLITQLGFRAAAGTGPASVSFSSITFALSTTAYGPNTGFPQVLTTDFATNLGPDNTVVYSGPLTANSPGCAGPSPCPFDIVVQLTTPFVFRKDQGRLLMDIVGNQSGGSGALDAVSFTFPPGGSIASINAPLGAATGIFEPSGDVVQIGFTAVPEPSSSMLMFGGAVAFGFQRRRRDRPCRPATAK